MSLIEDNRIKQDFKNAVEQFGGKNTAIKKLNEFKEFLIKGQFNKNNNFYYQIIMILELSNVKNYLDNDFITAIDINNCIISIEDNCGLARGVAQDLLGVILFGFGFSDLSVKTTKSAPVSAKMISSKFSSSKQEIGQVYGIDKYNNDLYQLQRIIDEAVKKQEGITGKFSITESDEKIIKEKTETLGFLCNQGHPKALTIKGELYLYGLGTEKNISAAAQCLRRAANFGSAKANTILGDHYFETGSYSKAFEHYSEIGAVANTPQQKERLASIIDNKKYHFIWMIFNVISLIITLIYSVFLMSGMFCPSGCKHYVWGILLIVFSLAIFGFSITSFIKEKYDARKVFLLSTSVMMCVCSFFALVF